MRRRDRQLAALLLVLSAAVGPPSQSRDLKAHTVEAFDSYARRVEERFLREVGSSDRFHRFDNLPTAERAPIIEELGAGAVFATGDFIVRDRGRELNEASDGRIHHWYAAILVPGVTLEQTLAQAKDYERHAEIYAPSVIRSRIEERDEAGSSFQVYYRFQQTTTWVTATLDTSHRVEYFRPAPDRAYSISRSTRVQQVDDPGPGETINPEGVGRGYMWRTNSYWRFREREGGVFVELESITLTSDPWILKIPPFRWLVRNLPRRVLTDLLEKKRDALLGSPGQGGPPPGLGWPPRSQR